MNKTILIVDDNPHILEAIELILTNESYKVHSIVKADGIIEKVKKFKPDVILLDLLLSGKNGQDITQQLKDLPETKKIPVIIISAHPSAEKAAKQAGADAFVAKPFDIEDLLSVIKKFIEP